MSYAVQTPVLDPTIEPASPVRAQSEPGARSLDASTVLVTALLVGGAVLLARWWWNGQPLVPVSWALPSAQAVFLLPGAAVVGLLALRVALGRDDSGTADRLMTAATRWATVWVGATAVWLVLTLAALYGGLDRLVHADNLVPVLAADDGAVSQLFLLQIALLVAFFGPRFVDRARSVGLLALTAVATLAAFPLASAAHAHDIGERSAVVPALTALQVLGLTVWVGALLAAPHLSAAPLRLRRHLVALGRVATAGVAVVGATAVLGGLFLPTFPTPPFIALVALAGAVLVAHVGRRHRQRVLDVVSARGGRAVAALVTGEVVVMGAVLLVACWLPTGG